MLLLTYKWSALLHPQQIGVVGRMASNITDYLQRHGVNLSPNFSEEWAHDNWHHWEAIEEHLKVTRGHTKDGKEKGIIRKILGDNAQNAYKQLPPWAESPHCTVALESWNRLGWCTSWKTKPEAPGRRSQSKTHEMEQKLDQGKTKLKTLKQALKMEKWMMEECISPRHSQSCDSRSAYWCNLESDWSIPETR